LTAWASYFSVQTFRGLLFSPAGDFSLGADSRMTVTDVDPGGEAERLGIRIGDRLDPATSFENRLYLQYVRNPRAGQSIEVRVMRSGGFRVVRLTAETQQPDAAVAVYYFAAILINFLLILVGSSLVLLRPSVMTWAFFVFCVATGPGYVLGNRDLPAWFVLANGTFAETLRALAIGAFLAFCARFPDDTASGRWRYLATVAAPLVALTLLIANATTALSYGGILHSERAAGNVQAVVENAAYAVGILALVATAIRERGKERGTAIILAGLVVGIAGRLVSRLIDPDGNIYTGESLNVSEGSWLYVTWFAAGMLQVAIPLTVAYAVVRHHALRLGAFANRTLTYGIFACIGFAAFVLVDFLLTKQFARDRFEVGLDITIGLAIGISFGFWHPRAVRLIDRLFLPDRYRVTIAMDGLRSTLIALRNDGATASRSVEAVAEALMLSSLAIFKKVPDGGFVRYASAGWPKGSAWHLYATDPIVTVVKGAHIRSIDDAQIAGVNVPRGLNGPRISLRWSRPTSEESLLLFGTHRSGRRPDHDEVRSVASLLLDFAMIGIETTVPPAAARRTFS
jgi:hypothetical protein